MAARIVTKHLAGVEDLLLGSGSVEQERAGDLYPITKLSTVWAANSVAELANLDTQKFTKAIVGSALYYWTGTEWKTNYSAELESLRRSYAEAGYNVVGTFQAGFTYVNANDVGIDEATGKGYTGPAGTVAAETDPLSGVFVDVSMNVGGVEFKSVAEMKRNTTLVVGDTCTSGATAWKIVASLGALSGILLASGLYATPISDMVYVEDFVVAGTLDIGPEIQDSLEATNCKARLPDWQFALSTKVTVPTGKLVVGGGAPADSPYKTYAAKRIGFTGAVVKQRGVGQFVLEPGAGAKGFTVWPDQQSLIITTDVTKVDGYSDFTAYPPLFECIGAYNGCTIDDILCLGVYDFFRSPPATNPDTSRLNNLEKCRISNIRGCVLNNFMDIDYATEWLSVKGVCLNPASLLNLPNYYSGADYQQYIQRLNSKISMRFVFLALNRQDGGLFEDVFCYAGRDAVYYKSESYGSNIGGSMRFQGFGFDMFNTVLRSYNTTAGFGTSFVNGWAALGIGTVVLNGAKVVREPGIVVMEAGRAQKNLNVEIVAFTHTPVETGANSNFDGNTTKMKYPIQWAADSSKCTISISCSHINSIDGFDKANPLSPFTQGFYASTDNNLSLGGVAVKAAGVYGAEPHMMLNAVMGSTQVNTRVYDKLSGSLSGSSQLPVSEVEGFDSGMTQAAKARTMVKLPSDGGFVTLQDFVDSDGTRLMWLLNRRGLHTYGSWDRGYVQIGELRLWQDGSILRGKRGVPSSISDGTAIVTL